MGEVVAVVVELLVGGRGGNVVVVEGLDVVGEVSVVEAAGSSLVHAVRVNESMMSAEIDLILERRR